MHGTLDLVVGPEARARVLLRSARLVAILAVAAACSDSAINRPTSPEVLNGVSAIASGDISSKGAFTQCQNDNPGPACNWVTGTLNAVHSAYREGEVIPFKLLVKNATTSGADAIHTITLSYGFQKATSQVNANYDFQARWDVTLGANANPCLDTSNLMNPFCTNGALKAGQVTAEVSFPAPTAANTPGLSATDRAKLIAAFNRFTVGQGKTASLVIYGGNFTGIAQPISNVSFFGTSDPSGNTIEARVTFTFRATSSDVMLLWGQHFAAGLDWQNNGAPVINGAAGQSGSPFHVVLETLDGASTGGKALNVSGDVIQLDPGAKIDLSPLNANNAIGESHTVTVTVSERTDASLPFAPAVGETVTFTLTNSNGATAVLDAAASTCDNLPTDANGQCIIVFSSATAGTVTVHAQSSVGVGGQTTLASSGTGGNNSGDALKTFVAGTLEWNKVDGSAAFLGGAVFTVCRTERWDSDLPNGGGYADTADVCFDVTDNVSGTDNTNASPADREGDAGKFRLGGIPLGKYTVTEKTAPTGYTKDPDTENASLSTTTASATIATAFVNLKPDARITITGAATNGIGESHTFTVTLEKNLGAGGGWVVATGEHVDVTLSNANGASYVLDGATSTCDNAGANTDSNGQCTIVFTSNSAGTVTGSASASLTVGGVPLSVNTGAAGVGTPGSSTNVVKTFVAGSLRWFKKDGLNALLGGAVFTVCRTENWDSDLPNGGGYADIDPDVCVDVTDNSAPDADADAGELQLNGLILGKYTIIEKTAPNGYIKDTKTENASLSTTTPSATITAAFVNISPEAFITIGPALDTNSVTQSHTFTAVMTVDPKGGGAPTIGNITITVTPTPSSLTVGTTSCPAQTGPDGNGKYSRTCTVQITSTAAGTFTANASGSATVAGATLTRDTDASTQTPAGTGGSGPATKVYVAPQLVLVKTPDSLQTSPVNWVVQPGATATFSIKLTNTGLGEALNTKLRDTLPNSGLDWSIASQSKAACQINAITVNAVSRERLDCDIGTLAPSDSFKVSVSAVVPTTYIQDQPVQTNTLPLEIDGNLVKNGTDTQDWASLPNDIFSCGTTKIGCAFDATNSQQDNSLGQGTSEDDAVPTIVAGSIPNQKSDLLRFYAVPQRLGSTNYLYLAWERVQAPNGTTNMDFELNQSKTASANNVTPVRTAGDILIQYDLAKGGTVPSIAIARWVTAASAAAENLGTAAQVCQAKNSFPCWGKTVTSASTDSVFAAINLAGLTETVSGGNLDALTFGEASINLQKAGIFKQGACVSFGSAYLKSRSSDSFNAELKDFVAPVEINVTNCSDKYLKNDAWGWASNFRPTANDTLGTPIRDHGVIKVGAPTASLWRIGSPTGERLAMSTERAGMWVMRGGDDE